MRETTRVSPAALTSLESITSSTSTSPAPAAAFIAAATSVPAPTTTSTSATSAAAAAPVVFSLPLGCLHPKAVGVQQEG